MDPKLASDIKLCVNPCFTGTTGRETTWPRVLAMTDRDIPLSYDAFGTHRDIDKDKKRIMVNFTIVDGISAGFSKTPYCNKGGKTVVDKDAQPLSVEIMSTEAGWGPSAAASSASAAAGGGDSDSNLAVVGGAGFKIIQCYPWTIVEGAPKEKDDRKQDAGLAWKIEPGMVVCLTLWRDAVRGGPDPTKVGVHFLPQVVANGR